jgi:flagellar basal body-associated protein FliL
MTKKKKSRHLRKSIQIALDVVMTAAIAFVMMYAFAGAVLQESYKLDPPSQEEIQHDPSLEQYAAEASK